MSGLATAKKLRTEAKRNRERWKEQLLDRRHGASQRPSVRLIPAGVCAWFGEARANIGRTPRPDHGRHHRRVISAVRVAVPGVVPREFGAVTVTTDVPAIVGVPLMAPFRGVEARPAGRPVAV
jgi:hypothetical protein